MLLLLLLALGLGVSHATVERPSLPLDTAQVLLHNAAGFPVVIEVFNTNCWLCPPNFTANLQDQASTQAVLPVAHPLVFKVGSNTSETLSLGDRGVYQVSVDAQLTLQLQTLLEPYDVAAPLLIAAGVFAFLALVYVIASVVRRNRKRQHSLVGLIQVEAGEEKRSTRVLALDAHRGLSIVIMIFVNYNGGGYWFFNHSTWNGLTVADLVFPWFIWIMGVSMALSAHSMDTKRKSPTTGERMLKVLRRTVILFCLGLFLNNGFVLSEWRIPGVLQRFAVAYLIISLIVIFVPKRGASRLRTGGDTPAYAPFVWEWCIVLAFVALWLLLTFLLPVPGCPTGYLGPAGLSEGLGPNCTGGAAGYIDHLIFGDRLIYQTPTCQLVYHTGAYDPEGVLGNLTSIFLVYLGLQAGRVLVKYRSQPSRHWVMLAHLVAQGIIYGVVGTVLALGRKDGGWIPICKNLWSLSFVLVQACTGTLLLALFFFLIDMKHWWAGSPFRFVGMNPILLYMSHELLQPYFPFSFAVPDRHGLILLTNLIGVSSWVIIAYYFYRIKYFVSV